MLHEPTPSQRDIAAALGVSVSTVSRALSNAPGISPTLRQRIVATADELGYDRASRPRSMHDAPAEVVGLSPTRVALFMTLNLLPSDSASFYDTIMKGAENELRERGAVLEAVFIDDLDPERQGQEISRFCRTNPGCGALLMGLDRVDLIEAVRSAGGEVVLLNGIDPTMTVDGVIPANNRGARLAVEHLASLGHRRVLLVTSRQRPTLVSRFEAYQRAATDAGIESFELLELPRLQPNFAHTAMSELLAAGTFDATGIICGSDMVAMGVTRALREHGIAVPHRCAVVGFDDIPLAAMSHPRLTTIRVDCEAIGRLGARRLLERMADPYLTPISMELACRLVVRESSAPPLAA